MLAIRPHWVDGSLGAETETGYPKNHLICLALRTRETGAEETGTKEGCRSQANARMRALAVNHYFSADSQASDCTGARPVGKFGRGLIHELLPRGRVLGEA